MHQIVSRRQLPRTPLGSDNDHGVTFSVAGDDERARIIRARDSTGMKRWGAENKQDEGDD